MAIPRGLRKLGLPYKLQPGSVPLFCIKGEVGIRLGMAAQRMPGFRTKRHGGESGLAAETETEIGVFLVDFLRVADKTERPIRRVR